MHKSNVQNLPCHIVRTKSITRSPDPSNRREVSSVKLPPLDIDSILLHRHAEVLHCQDRPSLPASTLPSTAVPAPLNAQLRRLLSLARSSAACCTSRAEATRSRTCTAKGRIAQGVVRRG